MKNINTEQKNETQSIDEKKTLVSLSILVEIHQILMSCKIDGDAVRKIAYVEQLLEGVITNGDL